MHANILHHVGAEYHDPPWYTLVHHGLAYEQPNTIFKKMLNSKPRVQKYYSQWNQEKNAFYLMKILCKR
jgi:hypothetical protein